MKMKVTLFSLIVFVLFVVVFNAANLTSHDKVSNRTPNPTEPALSQTEIADKNDTNKKGESGKAENYSDEFSVYNNPIDKYFLPKIYSWDASEAEIREWQDAYKEVWKEEFKNLMNWLRKKCIYDQDKKNIKLLEKSVLDDIEKSKEVILTELLDVYKVNPDSDQGKDTVSRVSHWGNGTQHRLHQVEGEIYRDASMRIINLYGEERKYEFRQIDYSEIK